MNAASDPNPRHLRKLGLATAGILLALVLHEAGGRFVLGANWTPEDGLAANALQRTELGLHATKADLARSTFANFSDRTPLFTDHDGLRVPGPAVSRSEEVREEILVIGASNTWGMGVAAEDSWPFVFERLMAATDWPVRVHNASGVGYTLPHMLTRAHELTGKRHYDRVFIVTPSSGLYMFGLGSQGDDWHFEGLQPHQVDLFALEYPFDERPEIESVNGWLLARDRADRGGILDLLRTRSLVGHRLVVKFDQHLHRLEVVPGGGERDEARLVGIAAAVGQGWRDLEDSLFAQHVGFHHVFLPAEWRDLKLQNDAFQKQIAGAFQGIAQVGKRYYTRLDLSGDPIFKLDMVNEPGGDVLPDGRHLSSRGHRRVAEEMKRWYEDRILPFVRDRKR